MRNTYDQALAQAAPMLRDMEGGPYRAGMIDALAILRELTTDLGGMTPEDAAAAVEEDLEAYENRTYPYRFTVTVHAPNNLNAGQVLAERLDNDEDYGFPYSIEWWRTPGDAS